MEHLESTLLVVGGGPGGYSAALRAAELGVDTVLVEAAAAGGTCLNVGCIPSKALIHVAETYAGVHAATSGHPFGIRATDVGIDLGAAAAWNQDVVSGLRSGLEASFAAAGIRRLDGWATLIDGKTARVHTAAGEVEVRASHVVLATGSRPVELPGLPWGAHVISSSGALALTEVPERLVVVGGGYIGLELGTAYAKLGSAVTIVEVAHSVLPTMDADIARVVAQGLDRHGIAVRCGTAAQAYDDADGTLLVETPEGTTDRVVTDLVLVAVGRAPVVDGWGLDVLDLDRQGRFLRIDDRCRTSMAGVYAVGDLTGEPMLAHRAMAQGRMVAEVIAGAARRWDVACIPAVVFTDPEVIVVGRSAAECAGDGIEVVEGRAPFTASGRAHSAGNTVGFVRVVVDAVDHVVLGVQGVGSGISELAAVAAVLVEMAARLGDVDAIIQAHPTRGETIQEAARAARARLP